jgi:hypothetical protein
MRPVLVRRIGGSTNVQANRIANPIPVFRSSVFMDPSGLPTKDEITFK